MAVYLIANVNVQDPERFKQYQRGVLKSLREHGDGKILAATKADALEGEEPRDLTVVFEFASEESARAWYATDAYQSVIPIRTESAPGASFVLLRGL